MEPSRRPLVNDSRWRSNSDYLVVNTRQSRRNVLTSGYLNMMAQLYNEQMNYITRHTHAGSYHHVSVTNWQTRDLNYLPYHSPNHRFNRNYSDHRRFRRHNDDLHRYFETSRSRGENSRTSENWRIHTGETDDGNSVSTEHSVLENNEDPRGRKIRPSFWKTHEQNLYAEQWRKGKSNCVSNMDLKEVKWNSVESQCDSISKDSLIGRKDTAGHCPDFEVTNERRANLTTNVRDFSSLPLFDPNRKSSTEDNVEATNWNWFSQEEQQFIVNTLKEIDVRHEQQMLKDFLLNKEKQQFKTPINSPSRNTETLVKRPSDINSEANSKILSSEDFCREDDSEGTIGQEDSLSSDDGIVILLPSSSPDMENSDAPSITMNIEGKISQTADHSKEVSNNWGKFCKGWDKTTSDTSSSETASPNVLRNLPWPAPNYCNETLTNDLKKLLGIRSITEYSSNRVYPDLSSDEEEELYKASLIVDTEYDDVAVCKICRNSESKKRPSNYKENYKSASNYPDSYKNQWNGKISNMQEASPSTVNKKSTRYVRSCSSPKSNSEMKVKSNTQFSSSVNTKKSPMSKSTLEFPVDGRLGLQHDDPSIIETVTNPNHLASAVLKKILGVANSQNKDRVVRSSINPLHLKAETSGNSFHSKAETSGNSFHSKTENSNNPLYLKAESSSENSSNPSRPSKSTFSTSQTEVSSSSKQAQDKSQSNISISTNMHSKKLENTTESENVLDISKQPPNKRINVGEKHGSNFNAFSKKNKNQEQTSNRTEYPINQQQMSQTNENIEVKKKKKHRKPRKKEKSNGNSQNLTGQEPTKTTEKPAPKDAKRSNSTDQEPAKMIEKSAPKDGRRQNPTGRETTKFTEKLTLKDGKRQYPAVQEPTKITEKPTSKDARRPNSTGQETTENPAPKDGKKQNSTGQEITKFTEKPAPKDGKRQTPTGQDITKFTEKSTLKDKECTNRKTSFADVRNIPPKEDTKYAASFKTKWTRPKAKPIESNFYVVSDKTTYSTTNSKEQMIGNQSKSRNPTQNNHLEIHSSKFSSSKDELNNKDCYRKKSYHGCKSNNQKPIDQRDYVVDQEKENRNMKRTYYSKDLSGGGKNKTGGTNRECYPKEFSRTIGNKESIRSTKDEENNALSFTSIGISTPSSKTSVTTKSKNSQELFHQDSSSKTENFSGGDCSLKEKENKSSSVNNKNTSKLYNSAFDNGKFGTHKFRKSRTNHPRLIPDSNDSDILKSLNQNYLWTYERQLPVSSIDLSSFYLDRDNSLMSIYQSKSMLCLNKESSGISVKWQL